MTTLLNLEDALLYPESDGKPMGENTRQYRWIVIIKENLEILFAHVADVFIAADLFWYPVQVNAPPVPNQAPDVMVVFGRPKGDRRSYKQWQENNIPPQVVFEILSPSNKTPEGEAGMITKWGFYQQYGVEEYYTYDPDEHLLHGWQRQDARLTAIAAMDGWVSPRLGIRFEWQMGEELALYYPNGQRFLTSVQLAELTQQERERAELERQQKEVERQEKEVAQQQAELERQRTEQERQQKQLAQQQADRERQEKELAQQQVEQIQTQLQQTVVRLVATGLPIAQVATITGFTEPQIHELLDASQ